MKKWNLIFDVNRCNSCNNCVLATKDEYLGNRFEGYSEPAPKLGNLWFTLERRERGTAPMIDVAHYISTCHHCENAPCINSTTEDVVSRRQDGIVVIDPTKAVGRRDLVDACPYGQIRWNADLDLPQKWSFDAHLLDSGWKEPRCTQVCPTQALRAIKISDEQMKKMASDESLVRFREDLGTNSRVWYKNFHRVTDLLIGGTVVKKSGDLEDCAEDVLIELFNSGERIGQTNTDAFGDFRFDGVKSPVSDGKLLVFDRAGDELAAIKFETEVSRYIGIIEIDLTGN